jgi:hypothetical protein
MGLGVTELLLPGYPGSPFLPFNWGQVEDIATQACSQVVAVERLLWEILATVGRDILHPIWVNLKKRGKFT